MTTDTQISVTNNRYKIKNVECIQISIECYVKIATSIISFV